MGRRIKTESVNQYSQIVGKSKDSKLRETRRIAKVLDLTETRAFVSFNPISKPNPP
jgi:hypothetical protein